MQDKITEIVEVLEKADELFSRLTTDEDARSLWLAGMEKLASAIWLCEYKSARSEEGEAGPAAAPRPA